MLETIFATIFGGNLGAPTQFERLDEPMWTRHDIMFAMKRLKEADERGLVADVLRCVP